MKLELSPEYISIEQRIEHVPKKMPSTTGSPLRQRFWSFHGKGNVPKGQRHYNNYYDNMFKEMKEVLKILSYSKSKSRFAKYVGVDQSMLSNYQRIGLTNSKTITKLRHMQRIVKGYLRYEKEMI